MDALLARPVFSVGERNYLLEDVILAAILRGDWAAVEEQARAGIALVRQAEEAPSEEEVQAAGQEFRYERDLIAAEDMEAWLERRGLTVDDWMDYLERSIQRQTRAEEIEQALERHDPADEEIAESAAAEAIFSGALASFAQRLAARAAVADRVGEQNEEVAGEPSPEELETVRDSIARSGLSAEVAGERIGEIARLERVFQDFVRRVATPSALRSQIEAHRLDWIRLDLRTLSFADESSAREASICLREDEESLEAVAERAHVPVEETRLFLADADPAARPDLLSARTGDLIGPLALGGEFRLFSLREKTMPSEDDPEVRRRAEEALVGRVVEQEVAARVKWHEHF